jgi:hypothetical protein
MMFFGLLVGPVPLITLFLFLCNHVKMVHDNSRLSKKTDADTGLAHLRRSSVSVWGNLQINPNLPPPFHIDPG